MSDKVIVSLLFKFGKKEYLEQLLNEGLLYFNTIKFFRECEYESGRGDKDECLFFNLNNFEAYVEDKLLGIGDNFKVYFPYDRERHVAYSHIYSVTALFEDSKLFNENKILDERLLELGDSVLVIYDGKEFFDRINRVINKEEFRERAFDFSSGKVTYKNIKNAVIFDPDRKTFLEKDNSYAYQSELRLLVSAKDKENPFIMNIGTISDIACIVDIQKFKNEYKLNSDGVYDFYLA